MATIDDREAVQYLIDHDGVYEGDPPGNPVVRIVEYVNADGNVMWGIVYAVEARMGMLYRYDQESEFVRMPRRLWERPVP
jgi:hypothetical protein